MYLTLQVPKEFIDWASEIKKLQYPELEKQAIQFELDCPVPEPKNIIIQSKMNEC